MSVLIFRQREDAAALWARYVALANELAANPKLAEDRAHVAARLRAHKRFTEVFMRGNGDAQAV